MTIIVNDTSYTVTGYSIYKDFAIAVSSLDEACEVFNALDGVTEYTFNNVAYTDMVLAKRTITYDGSFTVQAVFRGKSKAEKAEEELTSLREAFENLSGTMSKTNAAKIQSVLTKGVS